jgi:hypothetical protein
VIQGLQNSYLIEWNIDAIPRKNRMFFVDRLPAGTTVHQVHMYMRDREPLIDVGSVRLSLRVAIRFGYCTLRWSDTEQYWERIRPDGKPSGHGPVRIMPPRQTRFT